MNFNLIFFHRLEKNWKQELYSCLKNDGICHRLFFCCRGRFGLFGKVCPRVIIEFWAVFCCCCCSVGFLIPKKRLVDSMKGWLIPWTVGCFWFWWNLPFIGETTLQPPTLQEVITVLEDVPELIQPESIQIPNLLLHSLKLTWSLKIDYPQRKRL